MSNEEQKVDIAPDAIVAEIKKSAYHLYKMQNGTIVVKFPYYKVEIKPELNVWHFPFNALLENDPLMKDMTEEEVEGHLELLFNTLNLVQLPTYAFSSVELYRDVMNVVIKHLNESYEAALNKPLEEEDLEANIRFENLEMFKEILRDATSK